MRSRQLPLRKIAPGYVRVRVCIKVLVGVQFSSGAIVLEAHKMIQENYKEAK